jgi:hypothetical protein
MRRGADAAAVPSWLSAPSTVRLPVPQAVQRASTRVAATADVHVGTGAVEGSRMNSDLWPRSLTPCSPERQV